MNLEAVLKAEEDTVKDEEKDRLGNKGVEGGILALLELPEGRAAVARLAESASQATLAGPKSAFMCAEADWRECHRQVVAQRLLQDFGVTVRHIKRDGTLELHPEDHVLPSYFAVPKAPPQAPHAPMQGYGGDGLQPAGEDLLAQPAADGIQPTLQAPEAPQAPAKTRRWKNKGAAGADASSAATPAPKPQGAA
eukprot:g6426.t1